jgi:hypothetical protein
VTLDERYIGDARHSFTLVRGAPALEPRNTRAAPVGDGLYGYYDRYHRATHPAIASAKPASS